ncbi:ep23 [Cyclophragma undans nucleopolyhedrovirus]|uniref:Ep23 n=1 Tax=Cyclophragma undans nucleopolyhedrovirus TaxID=1906244 RepID=A0A288QAZ6_9ABAC|nr:ep23 [Cyclophragma undans nucleopolyhedrovirus]AOT85481.1 ep23 [Cyclophragma undans nucleopolyhedrovirus]
MNVNLYSPNGQHDNNIITFIIPHKTNSVIVYLFKSDTTVATAAAINNKTRLISGYENRRPISINLRSLAPPLADTRTARGSYVISCIRAPCLYRDLFQYNKYTASLGFVVTCSPDEIQVWHILSVHKTVEAKSTRKIVGMRVHTDTGNDRFYLKDLIIMSGNVPTSFLSNLKKCHAHHKDVDVFKLTCAGLHIDNGVVVLESQ